MANLKLLWKLSTAVVPVGSGMRSHHSAVATEPHSGSLSLALAEPSGVTRSGQDGQLAHFYSLLGTKACFNEALCVQALSSAPVLTFLLAPQLIHALHTGIPKLMECQPAPALVEAPGDSWVNANPQQKCWVTEQRPRHHFWSLKSTCASVTTVTNQCVLLLSLGELQFDPQKRKKIRVLNI